MSFARAVERRDPNESMNASFGLEVSVGVGAFDFECRGRKAGFLAVLIVSDDDLKSTSLGPAAIHTVEHGGPVAGLGAAGSGLNDDEGVLGIAGRIQEDDQFEGLEIFDNLVESGTRFFCRVDVIKFFGKFDTGIEVFKVFLELKKGIKLVLVKLGFSKNFAGFILMIPELGKGGPGLEFGNLLGQKRDVKDTS